MKHTPKGHSQLGNHDHTVASLEYAISISKLGTLILSITIIALDIDIAIRLELIFPSIIQLLTLNINSLPLLVKISYTTHSL